MDPSRNFQALLRNEVYRKIYEPTVYPANQFAQASPKNRTVRDPRLTIQEFVAKGIYIAPEKRFDTEAEQGKADSAARKASQTGSKIILRL